MSVMDDMLAWLTACIEQAEREAPHAHERDCFAWDDYHYRHSRDLDDPQPTAGDACECSGPLRAAAHVEAERRLVEAASAALREWPPGRGAWDHESETGRARSGVHEDVLRELAHGHRHDAPGFLEEWAPSDVEVTT